ncbi:MAG: protein-L-isoaspartate O-methyltransferase [Candidatus Moranbacteria bacterium]|nr:protein-L-isoaspartate O-methyltransferase [Candidatus Moranbacteria bacterium]
MSKLVSELVRIGTLQTSRTVDAFSEIGRIEFVPEEFVAQADADVALPIGYGQTISQPSTVALMFELLDPQEGHKILDVGVGSGWTTALFAYIVGENGKVIGIERKEALKKIGEYNVDKFKYIKDGRVQIFLGDGSLGYPSEAPFDRILVSAVAEEIPEELKKQLKVGGKMVIPVRNSLVFLEKKSEEEFSEEKYPGFSFVPLITS